MECGAVALWIKGEEEKKRKRRIKEKKLKSLWMTPRVDKIQLSTGGKCHCDCVRRRPPCSVLLSFLGYSQRGGRRRR